MKLEFFRFFAQRLGRDLIFCAVRKFDQRVDISLTCPFTKITPSPLLSLITLQSIYLTARKVKSRPSVLAGQKVQRTTSHYYLQVPVKMNFESFCLSFLENEPKGDATPFFFPPLPLLCTKVQSEMSIFKEKLSPNVFIKKFR